MKPTIRAAIRRTSAAAMLCAGVPLLSGCGWTPRDEFLLRRTAAVDPRPGDGSLQSSDWKAGRARQLQTGEIAARFDPPY